MSNEIRTGETLATTIGEQLQAKVQLTEQEEAARQAAEQEHARIERHKADEQATVMQHLAQAGAATPEGWRARREAARERGRMFAERLDLSGRVLPAAGVALAALGIVTRKKFLLGLSLPLVAGMLLRRREPQVVQG